MARLSILYNAPTHIIYRWASYTKSVGRFVFSNLARELTVLSGGLVIDSPLTYFPFSPIFFELVA